MAFLKILFKEYLVSYNGQNYEIIYIFLLVFINIYNQFHILTRIRIRNLELRIRIHDTYSLTVSKF
jgi:hypothetical protein